MSHSAQREGKAAMNPTPGRSQTASNGAAGDEDPQDSRKEKAGSAGQNLERQLVLVHQRQDEVIVEEDEE